jgi:hypothetical protein
VLGNDSGTSTAACLERLPPDMVDGTKDLEVERHKSRGVADGAVESLMSTKANQSVREPSRSACAA